MSNVYDREGAIKLLANRVEDLYPSIEGRAAAAKDLISELLSLNEGFPARREKIIWPAEDGVMFVIDNEHRARVLCDNKGRIHLLQPHGRGEGVEVELEYDPVGKKLVGLDIDTETAPLPGARRSKRDALCVLVDALIEFARPERDDIESDD